MRARSFALIIAAATATPAAAGAQAPGVDLQLVPKIGFYSPASELYDAAAAGAEIVDDRGGSLAIGLAVDLALPILPVDLRVGFDYVTSSEFTVDAGTTDATIDQQMIAITGDVILRPLPRVIVLQPYLLAGAGVKQYDFEPQDVAQGGSSGLDAFEESDFTLHAGLGVDLGLGPLALVAEASDYISWFQPDGAEDSEMQHDLFFMAGIRVGMF